jgi:hypothetical protein
MSSSPRRRQYVHLIRHGKPAAEWGTTMVGGDDPGLHDDGHRQAVAVAELLLAMPEEVRPVRVISSPLQRCVETAAPLATALGVAIGVEPLVAEIPVPRSVPVAAKSQWLHSVFKARWSELAGDIDYTEWAKDVAQVATQSPGAVRPIHFRVVCMWVVFACIVACARTTHSENTRIASVGVGAGDFYSFCGYKCCCSHRHQRSTCVCVWPAPCQRDNV